MLKGVTMNDEILNNNDEQPDEKELLRQRREEQIEVSRLSICLLYTSDAADD